MKNLSIFILCLIVFFALPQYAYSQQTAVDIVCNDTPAARFNKSGYVLRPKEGLVCPAYLPVNSSFLAAVALMAGGWDDAPDINAPGFPLDGTWHVRAENIQKLP
jgi:hypothetical protein